MVQRCRDGGDSGREADHADLLRAGEDLDFILGNRKELYLLARAEITADCVA